MITEIKAIPAFNQIYLAGKVICILKFARATLTLQISNWTMVYLPLLMLNIQRPAVILSRETERCTMR